MPQNSNNTSPTAFLFGAGISRKAGLPLANDITPAVLSGNGFRQHSNGRFLAGLPVGGPPGENDGMFRRILLLLSIVKAEADLYYFLDRDPNYEDLYFMVNQVFGCLSYDEDNPVAKRFADFLDEKLRGVFKSSANALGDRNEPPLRPIGYDDRVSNIRKLTGHCCNYIQDVVCQMIGKESSDLSCFRWLAEAVADRETGQKLFFSLNYDTLLEQFFKSHGVTLVDGFGEPVLDDGVSYFDPNLFDDSNCPHLVKLHGSLDWFINLRKEKSIREPLRILRPTNSEVANRKFELDRGPVVLVGTHNKPGQYTNPLFEDQHWCFRQALRSAKRLVVCGYSFCDKAINFRMMHWLNKDPGHQVILVHPAPNDCFQSARYALRTSWDSAKGKGQWHVLERKMEEVNWNELREMLV